VKKNLKLSDRVYECPVCGLEIDRDENAAKNLEKAV
jgi:putative transposase